MVLLIKIFILDKKDYNLSLIMKKLENDINIII